MSTMTATKKKTKTKKAPARKSARKVDFKRVGILTGGGDCPGLNAVLRAVVKTAIINYSWEIIGIDEGFEGLLTPGKTHKLELKDVRGLLPRGGTILGSTNRGNPFEHKKAKGGKEVVVDISETAMKAYEKLELDALIVIGGDGSLKIALKFYNMGMNVVGVPKTIDNDLMATDSTFGFRTAVMTATEAIDKLHTTGESHNRAMILEVMGRYVGWIALESGLAGGADIILIPEIPYDIDEVCGKIYRRHEAGSKFSIIVVAEGAKPKDGDVTVLHKAKDTSSLERLGGIGNVIGAQITEKTGVETRVTVLGHLQRGGTPSPFDRILSTRFGVKAVELVRQERFGRMVCYRDYAVDSVKIAEAVGSFKSVDPHGELVRTAEAIGIEFGR
ncbi:6-phosphofructokinase [Candidatus Zixiibacteriota bacterium]